MTSLYDLIRAVRGIPAPDIPTAMAAAVLGKRELPPERSHYQTADGYVYCTATGLRYAVKEE